MRNSRVLVVKGCPPRLVAAAQKGYTDYLAGRGFDANYDTMCERDQKNYENGRLWAANIKLALGHAPSWNTMTGRPTIVTAKIRAAAEKVGPVIPRTVMEAVV